MAMKSFMEPMGTEFVCEDPFDSIDDLLDFPNDDDDDKLPMAEAWGDCVPLAPSPAPAMIAGGSGGGISVGSASGGLDGGAAAVSGDGICSENDALGLYNDMDIANLEWLSNFFEDSELNFDLIPNSTTPSSTKPEQKNPSLSRSSSPISVLLLPTSSSSSSSSPSSSSSTDISPPAAAVPGRARTKRPRLPSFSARTFIPPSSNTPISSSPVPTKKIKRDLDSAIPSIRKCSHCDIQKTPQWRAGPMGPKTLCNACGVRYKSGRLFPEYRPAASPTFVPAVHSNSHKKVVEMRLRCTDMVWKTGDREIPVAAKNCDLLQYIRRRD